MASYPYEPLHGDSKNHEIRLLTLEPGPKETAIRCGLHHALLKEKPAYHALSYTWGDPSDIRAISIDGVRFDVRANLEEALRYLRQDDQPRVLWIDALCINQADIDERESQVRFMRDIYTSAEKIIAWTGSPAHDSEAALPAIQAIVTAFTQSTLQDSDLEAAGAVGFSPAHLRLAGFDTAAVDWAAVWTYLSRPYWRRMWVVQELEACGILPDQRGFLMAGSRVIPKWTMGLFMTFLIVTARTPVPPSGLELTALEPERTLFRKRLPHAFEMFGTLLQFRNFRSGDAPKRPDVWILMRVTQSFLASDIRDKLYALLGLADDALPVPIDYRSGPEVVFPRFIKSLIRKDQSLDCLLYNRMGTNNFGPSWIPDINLTNRLVYAAGWLDEAGTHRYRAAGSALMQVGFDDEHDHLIAKGVRIGVMKDVIGPLGSDPEPSVAAAALLTARQPGHFASQKSEQLMTLAPHLSPSEFEVFWRTLVMDGEWLGWEEPVIPAPQTMQEGVLQLLTAPESEREEVMALPNVRSFIYNSSHASEHRCFFRTASGNLMGLGPYRSAEGDVVVALFGAARFVVLRPKDDMYELVGDPYIQGGMFGELINGASNVESFTIC